MCCCKCCQYYWESIYWHCIEKHFCFDVNIALYEDEETGKQNDYAKETPASTSSDTSFRTSNNNIYDNMAFYDNVAMIANRSIFIIDPQDVRKPSLKDSVNFDNIDRRNSQDLEKSLSKELFGDYDARVITQQPTFNRGFPEVAPKPKSEPNLTEKQKDDVPFYHSENYKQIPMISTTAISLNSLATINEENHDRQEYNSQLLSPMNVKLRKPSLHERRVSKSLTLEIDSKRQEVPIIRQSSIPKFYIDTPDRNQNESSIRPTPIQALETPVVPKTFQFDLKTVVQLEDERREHEVHQHQLRRSATTAKETRIQQIRDKFKPIKLLRNASMQSLYSQSSHRDN